MMMFIAIPAEIWELLALNSCIKRKSTDIKNRSEGFEAKISYQAYSEGNDFPVTCLDRDWNCLQYGKRTMKQYK
jgi:hypothetical protein